MNNARKNHGEKATLGSLATITTGYQTRTGLRCNPSGSHVIIQLRDLNRDQHAIDRASLARLTPDLSESHDCLEVGDVLLVAKGAKNDAVALDEIPQFTLAAACFFVIKPDRQRILPHYLAWYLNQEPAQQFFRRERGQGAHMPVLRLAAIRNLEIPLPPREIQERIAALDSLCHREAELLQQLADQQRKFIAACSLRAAQPLLYKENHG